MGCSSSALNKAGDSSRFRSGVTSNEYFSTTEESEPCGAQPKPCTPGRESIFYGNVQRESLPPLEKPKASVVPTANGVKFCKEPSQAKDVAFGKDVTDQSAPTEKTQPVEGLEESEPPQPAGKDNNMGAGEMETVTKPRPLKGNAETEPVRTETKGQPSMTAEERDSPKTEGTENLQTEVTKPLGTGENDPPLETARDLQPQEAMGRDGQSQLQETIPQENESSQVLEESQFMGKVEKEKPQETLGKDEQSQLLETIPQENESSQILEEGQFVETSEEQQLQETLGKDEQSQLLEMIPKENVTIEISDRSQLVQTPAINDSLHKTPESLRNIEQFQPKGVVGSSQHPAGISETAANVEMAGKIHTDEEEQHIEGETGEKVETEVENEKVSEEEETGEAVDLSAAI